MHVAAVLNPYIKGLETFSALSEDNAILINFSDEINMAKKKTDYSFFIADVPDMFLTFLDVRNWFHIPLWIRGNINISGDINSIIRKQSTLRSDLARIKKYDFVFDTTNEKSKFCDFYRDMYLPYITKRYRDTAWIEDYRMMKKEFSKCDLILVKSKGETIAGGLIAHKSFKARLWCIGVNQGNPDHVKEGALGALNYFMIKYLKDKGFESVDFGGSRPFMKDGVLNRKKKWGMRITQKSDRCFIFKLLQNTSGVKAFLINNPFIFSDDKGLVGAVFVENEFSINDRFVEEMYDKYYYPGLLKIAVYVIDGGDSKKSTTSERLPDRICVRSASGLFA